MWMLNVCETLIANVKNNLLQNKKSNGELKDKLQELFEDNVADYDKFASWYGKNKFIKIGGKLKYEHEVIENFKKSVYGDSYEIKPFTYY